MGMGNKDRTHDNATPQQIYYAHLAHLQQFGTPEQIAAFSADGPPPPVAADGTLGEIVYHHRSPLTVEQLIDVYERMRTDNWGSTATPEARDGSA